MKQVPVTAVVRISRPSRDLARAEKFWVDGVGLQVLWRGDASSEGGHRLTMLGVPGSHWHLELVGDPETAQLHQPGPEDLLVLYLEATPTPDWLARIEAAGGRRVSSRNPYWDNGGVTVEDPDGYLLVLTERSWGMAVADSSAS